MKRILLHLDTDPQPSSFDAISAIDGGVEQLLSYGNVTPVNVVSLVQGAIFTRSPNDLQNTAIFIGGSDIDAAQTLLERVRETFFGPMRVSVMMDASGCNTTASAAVVCAGRHLKLSESSAAVFGGTGPVGRRVARILMSSGCRVKVVSRSLDRARAACAAIDSGSKLLQPVAMSSPEDLHTVAEGVDVVVAAGAAGVKFCSLKALQASSSVKVAIDLNAVPPLGIEGIESGDKAREVGRIVCYGALGVGGLKMRLHHHVIDQLFETNEQVFDAETTFAAAGNLR
ncbi:NAD(P)-dependent methylenetetrahydromethanopterin dehydrogenase [Rubinisphaera margarita]|uniref:NAD(P)-dependent methylenetetrahydromethanopterin dehydrogenase n=1 Tax=Rubinisphaera margarita TaxID=2909586 RepID=UPI001EE890BB|nr:NAD(P)-dependent methylenetetrahydromethanopterin dehydrogenase [Rubinisphaera margarita]MCG6157411.1 methylenetetrahydromethanopterin dehydrogenase [Rubinisphaera margarita]